MDLRRRLVLVISALLMFLLCASVVFAFVGLTQGEWGRELIRGRVERAASALVRGRVHIGRLDGSFVTDLSVDSIEIRDQADAVLLATGPIRLTFDPRDLLEGRILVRSVAVARPRVDLRQDVDGRWNIVETFPPSGKPSRHRGRGEYWSLILLERIALTDGAVNVTLPWEPPPSLRGADRTRAIAAALAASAPETRRLGASRFTQTYRWTAIQADLPRIRLAHPDSVGLSLQIGQLALQERFPPLQLTEVGGSIRLGTDSLFVDFPRIRSTHSRLRAAGVVAFGDSAAPQVRLRIDGDSIGFGDLRGFSDRIPVQGMLRLAVEIRDVPKRPGAFEIRVDDVDLRTRGVAVRGGMTIVTGEGGPQVRALEVQVPSLDLAAVAAMARTTLPVDGTVSGRLEATGGPLDRFEVDRFVATFRDRRAPEAPASLRLRGTLDLTTPSDPILRGVVVGIDSLDLRALHAIDSTIPPMSGHLVASVRLDSTWRALRFSALDLQHRDTAATTSQLTGAGRLRLGEVPSIDAQFTVAPLALATLARSFPDLPLRDAYTGSLRITGRRDSLALTTDLTAPSGRVEAAVIADVQAPLYRLTGQAAVTDFRPRLAFADTALPGGLVSFRVSTDLGGDSIPDLLGEAAFTLTRSQIEGVRIFGGSARLRFAEGAVLIDTIALESTAIDLSAAGALGLHEAVRDSVLVRARIDSLGGLRRWVARDATDSIAGSLRLNGVAEGWVGGFDVRGLLDGSGIVAAGSTARQLEGRVALRGFPRRPTGTFSVGIDTVEAAGFGLTRAFARAALDSGGTSQVDLQVTGASGTLARARARVVQGDDLTEIGIDSLILATGLQRWALEGGARITSGSAGLSVDPIVVRGGTGSSLRLEGALPASGAIALRASARQVPVADLAELLQITGRQEGSLDLDATLGGTRGIPRLSARATMRDGLVSGVRIDSLVTSVEGSTDGMRLSARLGRGATPDLRAEAELPIRLRFDGGASGVVDSAPLKVTVRSDSVSLRLLDLYTAPKGADPGTFALNLDVGGTWARPRIDGGLVVRNGTLQVAPLGAVVWRDVTADIGVIGDSIAIRRVSATSRSDGRTGRGTIAGWLAFADRENPRFDVSVRANTFHVYDVRNVADIDVSDSLRIAGSLAEATLTGGITVDRALVTIPEVTTKNVVSLEAFDRFGAADSTVTAQRLLPAQSTSFVDNLQIRNVPVRMGRDVRLFSKDEANIFLGGAVSITRSRAARGRAATEAQLALTGALQTVRGTYTLNLGPVSRKFELERGEVEFFGEPELNPTLDISAIHTIRQYSKQGSQPDVRIRVQIGGTLLQPTLALSTPDSARVKNADLISYLVTGGPSFEIGAEPTDYTSTAARVLIGSLGGFLSGKAAGGLCDDAVLSTSSADQKQKGLANVGSSVLEGMRFNCAKSITDKAFVRLDAGLCQVGQFVSGGGMGTAASLANSIGWKLDYVVRPQLTLSAGIEPPTSAVLCAQNVSARGFVPTPQQWGVDLFYAWRF